jgi:hypothetical protein
MLRSFRIWTLRCVLLGRHKTGTIKVEWHNYCASRIRNEEEVKDSDLIFKLYPIICLGELRNKASVESMDLVPKFSPSSTVMIFLWWNFNVESGYVTSLLQLNGGLSSKALCLIDLSTPQITAVQYICNCCSRERVAGKQRAGAASWPTFWNQTATRAFKLLTNLARYSFFKAMWLLYAPPDLIY